MARRYGAVDSFHVGTHDWNRRKSSYIRKSHQGISFHMLLRSHSGKAWFRNPSLRVIESPRGWRCSTAWPSRLRSRAGGIHRPGCEAEGDFVAIDREPWPSTGFRERIADGATILDVTYPTRRARIGPLRWCMQRRSRARIASAGHPRRSERWKRAGVSGRAAVCAGPTAIVAVSVCGSGRTRAGARFRDRHASPAFTGGYNADTQELFWHLTWG